MVEAELKCKLEDVFSEFEEKLNQTLVAEDLMMSGIYRNGGVMV